MYPDEYHQYNTFYPNTFNNSTLLSIYSFFENHLKQICIRVQQIKTKAISVDDLAGRDLIDRSRQYLIKAAGADLSGMDKLWNEIRNTQKIRNCIVHNNSNIIKDRAKPINKQELYPIIRTNKYLRLNEETGNFSISDEEFLIDAATRFSDYLRAVIDKLREQL